MINMAGAIRTLSAHSIMAKQQRLHVRHPDGINPGLIQQGDTTIERLVSAIHASPIWRSSRSAIVVVWDENDDSGSTTLLTGLYPSQNQNRVVLTVQTNYQGKGGVKSGNYYDSFSLLKSLRRALDCLA